MIDDVRPRAFGPAVRRVLGQAAAAGAVIALAEFTVSRHGVGNAAQDQLEWLALLLVHWTAAAVPFGLAFAVLDRRALERVPPWREYAIAVIAIVAVVAPALAFAAPAILGMEMLRLLGGLPEYGDTLRFLTWQLAFWGALGAILHRHGVASRVASRQLRRAELARTMRELDVGRARMQATCARVIPEFLLDALRRIEAQYGREPAAADGAIMALVSYLRLALASGRGRPATLETEAMLVEAYLRACGGAATLTQPPVSPASARDATVDPGIVVPALHRLRRELAHPGDGTARVGAEMRGGAAVFSVRYARASGMAAADVPAIERELFAGGALRLGAEREQDGALTLSVTVPCALRGAGEVPSGTAG